MITASEIFPIGYVAKTHGIRGELNIALDTEYNPEDFNFLVFDIDNIYVPFRIESSRGRGEASRYVMLKGVDGIDEAKPFVGKTVYALRSERPKAADGEDDDESEGLYLSDLVGYKLTDPNGTHLGNIVGWNDDVMTNLLLEVEKPDGSRHYIPYVEDWITAFDPDARSISADLPNGLL